MNVIALVLLGVVLLFCIYCFLGSVIGIFSDINPNQDLANRKADRVVAVVMTVIYGFVIVGLVQALFE